MKSQLTPGSAKSRIYAGKSAKRGFSLMSNDEKNPWFLLELAMALVTTIGMIFLQVWTKFEFMKYFAKSKCTLKLMIYFRLWKGCRVSIGTRQGNFLGQRDIGTSWKFCHAYRTGWDSLPKSKTGLGTRRHNHYFFLKIEQMCKIESFLGFLGKWFCPGIFAPVLIPEQNCGTSKYFCPGTRDIPSLGNSTLVSVLNLKPDKI